MNWFILRLKTLKKRLKTLKVHLDEILFSLSHKDYIVHIGHYSKGDKMIGNVGDPILYKELETLYDHITLENNCWLHRSITYEISRFEVWLYNKHAKAVFVGGHGLLMVDTGKNDNSGWQFNIKITNLKKLRCPIAFLAIGYNTFRGQRDFIPIFKKHINLCVSKSILFGLRNYGSINALKPYLTEENKEKITFQPCPTTMLALYEKYENIVPTNRIAICLAFDRFENRFGQSFKTIYNEVLSFARYWENQGYEIFFYIHNKADLNTQYVKLFEKEGKPLKCLSGMTAKEIFNFYRSQKLIVGMRGHSLMIPWGLRVPVISLTTQNKQKWFIETTGHPEYSIEITAPNLAEELSTKTHYILENYQQSIDDIIQKQQEFYELTKQNFVLIKNEISENHCRNRLQSQG